jgi:hypothetical protein
MKKLLIFLAFWAFALPLFAQEDIFRIAPGAQAQLSSLLNKPAMVKPAVATPLGKNWFKLETDAHVFTDQARFKQVIDTLNDIAAYNRIFDGKKSKLTANIISRTDIGLTVDFISVAIIPVINIRLNTPYRAVVTADITTDNKLGINVKQMEQDSANNGKIKHLIAPRYIEEINVDGKKYVYIRFYSIMDIDASILPGAKGTLEKNSGPTNEEALEMFITAAKAR